MSLKHLLVHVDSSELTKGRLELAATLAVRHGARMTGLFAESDTIGVGLVGRRSPDEAAAKRARDLFARMADGAGVQADWWALGKVELGELLALTAACCRYADLSIFSQHDPGRSRVPANLIEHVLLESGRPLLAVPIVGRPPDVGRRVVVAWTASRESARALNDAIPLLQGADSVIVIALRRPGDGPSSMPPVDIVAHLVAHGIQARYERIVLDPQGVGASATLLNASFENQADLIVAGIPGQGFPLPHAGSMARELLESMTTPLLLVH
jgi:nucleotide-binding universal stress UspA family protein